ncbi:hypothetical protein ADL26_04680 [Thermoactinomyces vulgaris]|nr:hypothetical protein ADL26_04680 [Thermoactinomyces vulgaris]
MGDAEDEEPCVAAQEDPPHLAGRRARFGLAAGELDEAVAEHDREQRERPRVDELDHEEVVEALEPARVGLDAGRAGEEVAGAVGEGDEQEHRAAGEVGGERPFGGTHGAAADARLRGEAGCGGGGHVDPSGVS